MKWLSFLDPKIVNLKHSDFCDVDPKTLTWKRDIEQNELARICFECRNKILEKNFKKGQVPKL
jgi:hypothetical protein